MVKTAKPKQKTKPKTLKVVPDVEGKIKDKLRLFYHNVEWHLLWEEWAQAVDIQGWRKYRSLDSLCKANSQTREQYQFLRWYLGPIIPDEDDYLQKRYWWCPAGPQDWQAKRENGSWYTRDSLSKFALEVTRRVNALEAVREAGNQFTLSSLVRAEKLAQSIDNYFNGVIASQSLGLKDNMSRANAYLDLQIRVQEFKAMAFNLYAKSHGIDFSDMHSFMEIMSSASLATGSNPNTLSGRTELAVHEIVRMSMAKAGAYKIPLPKEMSDIVIDTSSDDAMPPKKKDSLN